METATQSLFVQWTIEGNQFMPQDLSVSGSVITSCTLHAVSTPK
jgi:hypothetical protein